MKKTLVLVASVVFSALMAVSCGCKQTAETEVVADSTEVVEAEMVESTEEVAAEDNSAEIISAAKEAGLAKCNCYNSETKTVSEDCVKAVMTGAAQRYSDNELFVNEMDKAYSDCLKEKAAAAAQDAAVKGANKAADALSKKLAK